MHGRSNLSFFPLPLSVFPSQLPSWKIESLYSWKGSSNFPFFIFISCSLCLLSIFIIPASLNSEHQQYRENLYYLCFSLSYPSNSCSEFLFSSIFLSPSPSYFFLPLSFSRCPEGNTTLSVCFFFSQFTSSLPSIYHKNTRKNNLSYFSSSCFLLHFFQSILKIKCCLSCSPRHLLPFSPQPVR